jgi:hypothetical protein
LLERNDGVFFPSSWCRDISEAEDEECAEFKILKKRKSQDEDDSSLLETSIF